MNMLEILNNTDQVGNSSLYKTSRKKDDGIIHQVSYYYFPKNPSMR